MKQIFQKTKTFFWPPSKASWKVKLAPYGALILLFMVSLVTGAYTWEYTNSPDFCGMTCHTMPPEYTSYQLSPHAQVKCVECHIGREFIGSQIGRKIGDFRHVTAMAFSSYEYPIRVKSMRPAREICELCHSPEKFSDSSLREIVHYANDTENTPYSIFLNIKTGGGLESQGLGQGIHWHIQQKVLYYPTDPGHQNIPYVKVVDEESNYSTEYVDAESSIDPLQINESELVEMDCITCHNRISHSISQPEEAIDQALSRQLLSSEIPEIKLKAVEVLRGEYKSREDAFNGISKLSAYYQETYPDYYAENPEAINQAVSLIKEIYAESVFIDQKVDWDTHPDNLGHQYSPGCFRCHDGNHLSWGGNAIQVECNLCHNIPTVSGPEDTVIKIELNNEQQPKLHGNSNWLFLHGVVFNEEDEYETCSACHETTDYQSADNGTFCSNAACHTDVITYTNFEVFDSPDLQELLYKQLPHYPSHLEPITSYQNPSLDEIHANQEEEEEITCETCHGDMDAPIIGPPPNQVCMDCHGETAEGVEALTAMFEPNPHDGHGGDLSCSVCHWNFGPEISSCGICHQYEPYELIEETSE